MNLSAENMQWLVLFCGGAILYMIVILNHRIERLATTLNAARNSEMHDASIDDELSRSLTWYRKQQDDLEAEKKALPGIDLWSIARTGWKQDLLEKAEKLRKLIYDAYGTNVPGDPRDIERIIESTKIDDSLAHDLATFAHAVNDLKREQNEWITRKIELLGATRKSQPRFNEIALAEFKLRELEDKIQDIEVSRQSAKHALLESFRAARDHHPN